MISSLKISDTVELCVTDKDSVKHTYKTKIEDISLNNIFHTMAPTSETGRPVAFVKGHKYEMFLQREDGISMWMVEYIGSQRDGNLISCQFQAVKGPVVTQRREYFRQPVSLDCRFRVISIAPLGRDDDVSIYHSISDISFEDNYEGRIIDLSGGGCAFNSNLFLPLQSKIKLSFTFRGSDFEFDTLILDRRNMADTGSRWEYKYRSKFEGAPTRTIDNLIKLVFEQQREDLINSGALSGDRFI